MLRFVSRSLIVLAQCCSCLLVLIVFLLLCVAYPVFCYLCVGVFDMCVAFDLRVVVVQCVVFESGFVLSVVFDVCCLSCY